MLPSLRFLCSLFWRGEVVVIGVPLLYGFGVGAMYADDYIVAAALYFISIAWGVSKAVAWEDVKGHDSRKGISLLILLLGALVFVLSMVWMRHRERQVESASSSPLRMLAFIVGEFKFGKSSNVTIMYENTSTHEIDAKMYTKIVITSSVPEDLAEREALEGRIWEMLIDDKKGHASFPAHIPARTKQMSTILGPVFTAEQVSSLQNRTGVGLYVLGTFDFSGRELQFCSLTQGSAVVDCMNHNETVDVTQD